MHHESFNIVFGDLIALNGSSTAVDFLVSKGTNKLKNLFGKKTVESFKFRTCVKLKLSENRLGQTEIIYESLTAQDLLRKRPKADLNIFHKIKSLLKLKKFVISDEGLPCVNTIEKVYLGLLVAVVALGILSLFRLSYYKDEIRKVFDPRMEFTYTYS